MDQTSKSEVSKSKVKKSTNLRSIKRPPKILIKAHKLYSTDNYTNRLDTEEWVLPNSKRFPEFVQDLGTKTREDQREPLKLWQSRESKYANIGPYEHQKFVSDFMSDNTPYRGLLLYHGLGSGKSGASIMITEGFKHRQVVIMLPASLKDNYERELETFSEIAYKKNYHWTFVDLSKVSPEEMPNYIKLFRQKGVTEEIFKKINNDYIHNGKTVKGLWMINYKSAAPNFDKLSPQYQSEIESQIRIMHDNRFKIINYNSGAYTLLNIFENLVPNYKIIYSRLFASKKKSSLTTKDKITLMNYILDPKNNIANPFDNKVVVVDEIHNLTSSMVGSSFNGPRIYELLMRANNMKLVLLSGTPVINYAFELGLMLNLLRGFIVSYEMNVSTGNGLFSKIDLLRLLERLPIVDRIYIDESKKTIEVTRIPIGFEKKNNRGTVVKSIMNSNPSPRFFEDYIVENLSTIQYVKQGPVVYHRYTMFPDILTRRGNSTSMIGKQTEIDASKDLFNEKYIDTTSLEIQNVDIFKGRITGLVSFFNEISGTDRETGANIFPELKFASEEETVTTMSNFQFIEYAAKRQIERALEETANKMRAYNQSSSIANAVDSAPNLFRVFSRQKGLFVFPPNIERPMPPKKDKEIKHNISSALSEEDVNSIMSSLKQLFTSKEGDIEEKLPAYLSTLDKSHERVAQEIIKQLYIDKIPMGESDLTKWYSSIQFDDDAFMQIDIKAVSEVEELDYKTQLEKAISKLTVDNLSPTGSSPNLTDLSPKYALMLKNINNTPGLVFGYSQFRSVEGIEIFARILQLDGYRPLELELSATGIVDKTDRSIEVGSRVRYENIKGSNEWKTGKVTDITDLEVTIDSRIVLSKSNVYACVYSLWTGTESTEERHSRLDKYISEDNMYGQICLILLTTQSGAEGISLRFVRQVHIMEPYWNNVRIEQVIGRARRIKSHVLLPEIQRNVTVFNYKIKFSTSQKDGSWISEMGEDDIEFMKSGNDTGFNADDYDDSEDLNKAFTSYAERKSIEINTSDHGLTSDEVLAEISTKKKIILDKFLQLMKESAIDCDFNKDSNIRSNAGEIKCNNTIVGENGKSYDIWKDRKEISSKASSEYSGPSLKEVVYKRLNIFIREGFRVMIELPPRLSGDKMSGNAAIASLPNGHYIYDYYIYNGLYYKISSNFQEKQIIGRIIQKEDGPYSFNYKLDNDKFKSRFADYINIEKCIKLHPKPEIKTDRDLLLWADTIKECHRKIDTWKCFGCDQLLTSDSCEECGIDKLDVVQLPEPFKQLLSKEAEEAKSQVLSKDIDHEPEVVLETESQIVEVPSPAPVAVPPPAPVAVPPPAPVAVSTDSVSEISEESTIKKSVVSKPPSPPPSKKEDGKKKLVVKRRRR